MLLFVHMYIYHQNIPTFNLKLVQATMSKNVIYIALFVYQHAILPVLYMCNYV